MGIKGSESMSSEGRDRRQGGGRRFLPLSVLPCFWCRWVLQNVGEAEYELFKWHTKVG